MMSRVQGIMDTYILQPTGKEDTEVQRSRIAHALGDDLSITLLDAEGGRHASNPAAGDIRTTHHRSLRSSDTSSSAIIAAVRAAASFLPRTSPPTHHRTSHGVAASAAGGQMAKVAFKLTRSNSVDSADEQNPLGCGFPTRKHQTWLRLLSSSPNKGLLSNRSYFSSPQGPVGDSRSSPTMTLEPHLSAWAKLVKTVSDVSPDMTELGH